MRWRIIKRRALPRRLVVRRGSREFAVINLVSVGAHPARAGPLNVNIAIGERRDGRLLLHGQSYEKATK